VGVFTAKSRGAKAWAGVRRTQKLRAAMSATFVFPIAKRFSLAELRGTKARRV